VVRFTALVLVAISTPALSESLHLVCLGEGSTNQPTSSSAYLHDNSGNSAWGNIVGSRSVPFDDQVNIDLTDDSGRIRMPRVMLPIAHGGSGGWFEIRKIVKTDQEITGSIQVNFVNSPKLRLDRITGRISIHGMNGDYTGECAPYDPATVQRKF